MIAEYKPRSPPVLPDMVSEHCGTQTASSPLVPTLSLQTSWMKITDRGPPFSLAMHEKMTLSPNDEEVKDIPEFPRGSVPSILCWRDLSLNISRLSLHWDLQNYSSALSIPQNFTYFIYLDLGCGGATFHKACQLHLMIQCQNLNVTPLCCLQCQGSLNLSQFCLESSRAAEGSAGEICDIRKQTQITSM